MPHERFHVTPVGVVHSPYGSLDDAPRQGFVDEAESELEIFEDYTPALAGLDDVVRVTVLYWAHRADRASLAGDDGVGAFARRSPNRPNPLSLCTCTVLGVEGTRIRVTGLDALDGSPVVDVKPALQSER